MYHYEVLVLDANRTRSVWLTHPNEFRKKQLDRMLDDAIESIPKDTLNRWAEEARASQQIILELAQRLEVDSALLDRLEHTSTDENKVTLSAVLDPLVDQVCAMYGFTRLIPTAAVARYGQEVLAA